MDCKKKPAASLCSLERVVRLPAYRGASGPPERLATHRRGNEGAAAGKAWTKKRTGPNEELADGIARASKQRVLARSRRGRATGNEGNGHPLAIGEPPGKKLLA